MEYTNVGSVPGGTDHAAAMFPVESPVKDVPGQTVRWVPVAEVPNRGPALRLGVSAQGAWVLDCGHAVVEYTDDSSMYFLLPCLEQPRQAVEDRLRHGLISIALDETRAEGFPYRHIVITALESGVDYWVGLALPWLETVPVDDEVAAALTVALNSERVSQQTRHGVWNLLPREMRRQRARRED